jgi:putative DNA methylase
MTDMTAMPPVPLIPFALKDTPSLIETVFPAQKVSFEAQRERKAVAGQTLTAIGSYWKGRKPLILVRAVILGSLLPQTDNPEKDLELFEALMSFDIQGLSRRAVEAAAVKPNEIARVITLNNPWDYFSFTIPKGNDLREEDVSSWRFPLDAEDQGFRVSWKRGISDGAKADIFAQYLATLPTYEARAKLCKRPEEVDQVFLLAPVWPRLNDHLAGFGINAESMEQLIEQLGILRYGRRPKVGDTFAGGGSIPFEAARIGCDAYASDLNPIACMLNWGNFNVIGADQQRLDEIDKAQAVVVKAVNAEIATLGVESRANGDRAKAFLYCLEVRCPESGWMIPLSPSWAISKSGNVIATLEPDHERKRFNIKVKYGATAAEMKAANRGTVQDGCMVYSLDGKIYTTPIKTLRGDYRMESGATGNRLRRWEKADFIPRSDDVFKERLYAIQWIKAETLSAGRPATYFASVDEDDLGRERKVEKIVADNLAEWQEKGLVPEMPIEPGDKTDEPIRTRGWQYWHQLFNARQLLVYAALSKHMTAPFALKFLQMVNTSARLTRWTIGDGDGRSGGTKQVFDNQALNTLYNYGCRASGYLLGALEAGIRGSNIPSQSKSELVNCPADRVAEICDIFVTDPPYADAVNYHEITEFFIAWLRKNPPVQFNKWKWDSRRALAIKGDGDDFRRDMIDAYSAMTKHMPDNGMQCVMFTHQSAEVWSDMVGIFWAAGLQVVAAWYIATETTSELKKGGYVQGTVTLMLRKRPSGEKVGFKQRILPAVRNEVATQIKQMMHLNDEVEALMGEPVFNDADLQMAGYAAALKVLTGYTKIGETDVTTFALRPRIKGEITVVDEIVQQASEAANSLLVPEGVALDTWQSLSGVQRFYLRMLDMESVGASKLDNYQNFAKAFRVEDYTKVMASMAANSARLKHVDEFTSRELTGSTEIGPTWLGQLIIAMQQLLGEVDPQTVVKNLAADLPDYMEIRLTLIDLATFLSRKSGSEAVRSAAEVLAARMQNQRALDQ